MRIHLGRKLRIHTLYSWLAEEPPAEGDTVATQVHERAAARLLDVPEPVGVRSRVLLALLYQVDSPEGAFVRHLLCLDVFRREEKLLGVEKEDAGPGAGIDHRVGFLERDAKRLLADDMLSGRRGVDRHACVEAIGRGDRDHFDPRVAQHLTVVGVEGRDSVSARKSLCVPLRWRGNSDYFHLFRHRLHRGGDAIRLETRADNSDFYFRHGYMIMRDLVGRLANG